jgi:osmotically-inducible protein OsmY
MRFMLRLFLLFVLVIALVWVFRAPLLTRLGLESVASSWRTGGETPGASSAAQRSARGRLADLDFSVEKIAQELKATGRVVRRKVAEAGRQIEEGTRDGRTTAKLKARFALDPELKTREIDVSTDNGLVTLKGHVDSPEEVARAVRMAVEEDDVVEVTSTLQVTDGRTLRPLSVVEVAPQTVLRAPVVATPRP